MNLNHEQLQEILKSIRDSLTSNQRSDDIALPIFDPEKSDNGAETWCKSIELLGTELGWSSIQKAAKAGKALRGSALSWFESWEPEQGRNWENFSKDIIALYPEKKNLSEKLSKAVLYSSDSSDSYCDYAREKLRLLQSCKINFSENQLIELVCGGIREPNIKITCHNTSVTNTSELITLFSTFSKQTRKRPLENNADNSAGPSIPKQVKTNKDRTCFSCGKLGHISSQCLQRNKNLSSSSDGKEVVKKTKNLYCVFCSKEGHSIDFCFHKKRIDKETATSTTEIFNPESKEIINVLIPTNSWLEIAQQKDDETQSLIEKVQAGELDTNQYLVKNNLLYYKTNSDGRARLYVPKGSRLSILRLFHDENCHVGYDKTFQKLSESFWFPGLTSFIKKYLSHCLVCTERKSHTGPKQGMLYPIEKTPIPFHTVHLDCTGPFQQSSAGYKYILMIIDGFTKYCILKPLKSMGGDEMVNNVRESLTLFSTPSLVITDRGTNFSCKLLQTLFRSWQVEHHMITTGTPRANGQIERYVKTIIDMLTTSCNTSDWPNGLWKVQLSLNSTIQKSTGFAPIRLLVGLNGNIPCIQARLNDVTDNGNDVQKELVDVRAERLLAHQRLVNVASDFKKRFDLSRRDNIVYNIGDVVYVNQDHRRHDKLRAKFKGPYEIINILENDRFSLKGKGSLKDIIIAKEKLRRWPGEWIDQNVLVEDYIEK
ncbi:uncharacterized protein LOC123867897 [Maniola jurtina]|uniref:uncharacterized protein LOC123867897 n=1 Tax=Maniola jurtina TaxID=191418 RepID=UPI001E68A2E0|nr:uncharacterized protein LOC123867897 [Maniola jurtina]